MLESADQTIVRIAAKRSGVCTREELCESGVTARQIDLRLSQGWLRRIRRGVYVVDDLATERTPLEIAMTLTSGALSHATAADLHGFRWSGDGHHLIVPKSSTNQLPGFTVHETRLWFDDDIMVADGLRVTSAARTICDLARNSWPDRLRHMIEAELIDRTLEADDLLACHQRLQRRGRHGSAKLGLILDELIDETPIAESVLEQLLFAGLTERGCVGLTRQFRPPWFDGIRGIVDIAEPVGKTIIEADGRRWHTTTQAMEEDRRRDRLATRYGYATIRVGWRELKSRPSTFDEIIELVDTRRSLVLQAQAKAA